MNPEQNNQKQEFGPVVGIIVIVGLLVVGGLYFLLMEDEPQNEIQDSPTGEANS